MRFTVLMFVCFNLNLLECKSESVATSNGFEDCFNLNLLECKFVRPHQKNGCCVRVLISTYWNVNLSRFLFCFFQAVVLISTYWNVNTAKDMYSCIEAGFNLNLLECKFPYLSLQNLHLSRFNLNLLECKSASLIDGPDIVLRFNLNLLECKSIRAFAKCRGIYVLISTYWNVNIS